MIKLSVVLPVFNEEKSPCFLKVLESLPHDPQVELIIVDGGSTDNTVALLKDKDCVVIENGGEYRSKRLNAGIKVSKGEVVLLHHPRSILSKEALKSLLKLPDHIVWGAFTHKFDQNHWLLRFTSFYSNYVRSYTQKIFYLDHCIFFRKAVIQGSLRMPEIPIFEDTELCKILRESGRPTLLKPLSVTSAVRFQKNGVYRQAIMNQVLKFGYSLGVSKEKMDKLYEKGLSLNSKKQY
ncbi:MAG: glycosyltransferase [Bdellovibrionales bacterium]